MKSTISSKRVEPPASEFELIRWIQDQLSPPPSFVEQAIGDDAAVVDSPEGKLILTSDVMVENVHFDLSYCPPFPVGRKALLVNLSDLAAMGAVPRACLLTLVVPPERRDVIKPIVKGLLAECKRSELPLVGGDLSRGSQMMICVAAVGAVDEGEPLTRSGAQAGDTIAFIGDLGYSRLGLELLESGQVTLPQHLEQVSELAGCAGEEERRCVAAHLFPQVPVREAIWLRRQGLVHAAIDVSDGLAADLGHLLENSGVSGELTLDAFSPPSFVRGDQRWLDVLLNGGEDYGLLMTMSEQQLDAFDRERPAWFPELRLIGMVTEPSEPSLKVLSRGRYISHSVRGFDHFR